MVSDYIRLDMLPSVSGIYDKEDILGLDIEPYEKDDKETFFIISHMHIDHMGGLGMLADDIPVHMSKESLNLYQRLAALQEIDYKEHKNCLDIPYGEILQVEDIAVEILPIDHDVVGASGFMITTPEGTIAYTGDYRLHGFHPEYTRDFAKAVKGVDVLITEGVTVSFEDIDMLNLQDTREVRSEYSLLDEMTELSLAHNGLIVVNPYNRNVERIYELQLRMKELGRILILDPIQADFVNTFFPEETYYVYAPVLGKQVVNPSRNIINKDEILDNPSRYMLQLDYSNMYELFDLLNARCKYIHMDGAPLGDYDPSYNKIKALLESMEIPYEYRSVGGHALPYDLKEIIDIIEPNVMIPLHSFRPEQVRSDKAKKIVLPNAGDCYELREHKLVE